MLSKKLLATVGSFSLAASLLVPAALAAGPVDVNVMNNGAGSQQSVKTTTETNTNVSQSNKTDVHVSQDANANTGGNSVKENVSNGGSNDVTTGDAKSSNSVWVSAGANDATVNQCGCGGPTTVNVKDNGAGSKQWVTTKDKETTKVTQKNTLHVNVWQNADSNTGWNKVSKNVGGGNSVDTGNAWSKNKVKVTAGANSVSL